MTQTLREFIKTNAIAATAAAAGLALPGIPAMAAQDDSDIRWDKADQDGSGVPAERQCAAGSRVTQPVLG